MLQKIMVIPSWAWQGYTHAARPAVSTQAVTDITATTATGNGTILDFGNSSPTQHGVCWNASGYPTLVDGHSEQGPVSATGAFSYAITGLDPATIYYVRAYATNSSGTSYGNQVQFRAQLVGEGTQANPYLVSNLAALEWISQNSAHWNKYYLQTADIDASATSTWNSSTGWSPIGSGSGYFTGTYDGQGYSISGVTISRSGSYQQGFFGAINGATIKQVRLTGVNISGFQNIGGLIGFAEFSTIIECSSGAVNGLERTGGLVGWLAGYNNVNNCSSAGTVSGGYQVGGLVGYNQTIHSTAIITNCYSTGSVDGSGTKGGLVGFNNAGIINNSFWDTQTSGQSTSAGGTGKTTAEMKTLSTFTNAGWDFEGETANGSNDDWDMDLSGTINNGYPILSWQNGGDASLPVELASFSARCEGRSVVLEWITESEVDHLGFILERSDNSTGWIKIASYQTHDALKGRGNTSKRTVYSFTDQKTEAGQHYHYRLCDVNIQGEMNICPLIFILTNALPHKTVMENASPNPFNPQTYIAYHLSEDTDVTIRVFDMLGRSVKELFAGNQQAGSYHVYWHGDDENGMTMPTGVYIILMQTAEISQIQKVLYVK